MGEPVPDGWPVIADDKFYKVECTNHGFDEAAGGCGITNPPNAKCCSSGANLNSWIRNDRQCSGIGLCLGSPWQRLIDVQGPFDSWEECQASF